jgi:hypothetical protein
VPSTPAFLSPNESHPQPSPERQLDLLHDDVAALSRSRIGDRQARAGHVEGYEMDHTGWFGGQDGELPGLDLVGHRGLFQ